MSNLRTELLPHLPSPPNLPPLTPLTPIIAGPTAGGKSDLAIAIAHALRDRHGLPAEILTADAFQVYTGLDIGTAKPTIAERQGIPHHLIDIVPTGSTVTFTVDDWLRLATDKISNLRASGILPIVVGGTHLYIKALLDGLFDGPDPDPTLRDELTAMDPAVRRAELVRIDPAAAARIHPNDLRRTIRALEVFRLTGQAISSFQKQWDPQSPSPSPYLLITLNWETEALNRRINARVRQMIDRGLLDECRALSQSNAFTPQSSQALGYKQLLPIVRGLWPPPPPPATALEAAIEQIKIGTRRFAKNQRTWLRRLGTTPGAIDLQFPPSQPGGAVDRIVRTLCAEQPPIIGKNIHTKSK